MRKLIFITFVLLVITQVISAQSRQLLPETPVFDRKWVTGGDFGLGFSNIGSNILLAPTIGYKINPDWEAGSRLTYNYRSYRLQDQRIRTHNFALGMYTNYEFWRGLFAHLETEWLRYTPVIVYVNPPYIEQEAPRIVESLFIGGGYRQYYSSSGYAYILLLYNLNDSFDSPYSNPIFRAGVSFGFGKRQTQAKNKSTYR